MYQDFAYVYDKLMADVPYDDWIAFYQRPFGALGRSLPWFWIWAAAPARSRRALLIWVMT